MVISITVFVSWQFYICQSKLSWIADHPCNVLFVKKISFFAAFLKKWLNAFFLTLIERCRYHSNLSMGQKLRPLKKSKMTASNTKEHITFFSYKKKTFLNVLFWGWKWVSLGCPHSFSLYLNMCFQGLHQNNFLDKEIT